MRHQFNTEGRGWPPNKSEIVFWFLRFARELGLNEELIRFSQENMFEQSGSQWQIKTGRKVFASLQLDAERKHWEVIFPEEGPDGPIWPTKIYYVFSFTDSEARYAFLKAIKEIGDHLSWETFLRVRMAFD